MATGLSGVVNIKNRCSSCVVKRAGRVYCSVASGSTELAKPICYPVPWGDKLSSVMHPRFFSHLIAEKRPSSMGSDAVEESS